MRSRVLPEIQRLDPFKDHQRIMVLTCRVDFPFDTTRALELALFRTFCIPSIGSLLDRTREFGERTQKRYDDTDIIVSEIVEHGYDSDHGRRAIARMNEIHGRFQISNKDFLYVLSTFVYVPIQWLERFGWRRLHENEKLSMFYFWRAVGERMHIRDIPADTEIFEKFSREYEEEHFQANAASRRVADATMRMFAGWMPAPLQWMTLPAMRAIMDDALLVALGLSPASRGLQVSVETALRLRGAFARALVPRSKPHLRTRMKRPSYPCGHVIESIGPTHAPAGFKCPFSSSSPENQEQQPN